jgi:uracil-DNA glycosylase family 4
MMVAEALGKDEALAGVPLVGTSGKVLNRMLSRMDDPSRPGERLRREDFVLANVVNCRPPNNELTKAPYETQAIDHCRSYLLEHIRKFRPRAILAMGNQPLRWFTGNWGIESLRGYKFDWSDGDLRIPVVGSYHPAYLARGNWELVRVWQLDLRKALALASGQSFEATKRYQTHPSPAEFDRWVMGYFDNLAAGAKLHVPDAGGSLSGGVFLSFDIETPYIKSSGGDKDEKWNRVLEDDMSWMILRISFSYKPFEAISVPWTRPYMEGIKRLLASSGPKIVWNRHFDVPRVAKAGCPAEGLILDGMELWHYLEPSLPMGLKYVATFHCPDMGPWKLMSHSEPEWYNAADSDTALRTTLAMIDRVKMEGRWEIFLRHVVELGGILDRLTIRGINVDREQREIERKKFEALLFTEEQKLQPMIPVEVLPKKVYKNHIERLQRDGQWVEGRMVKVTEALTEKEQKAWLKKMASLEKKAAKLAEIAARKTARAEEKKRKAAEKAMQKSKPRGRSVKVPLPVEVIE